MGRCLRQGYRSYPDDIYLCPEAQLAHLYKTTSCEVDVAARRLEGDVIHVAAGALVFEGQVTHLAALARQSLFDGSRVLSFSLI